MLYVVFSSNMLWFSHRMISKRTINLLRTPGFRFLANSDRDSRTPYPISMEIKKSIDDVLEPSRAPTKIKVSDETRVVCAFLGTMKKKNGISH